MEKGGHTTRGIICTTLGAVLWGVSGTCSQYLFTYKGVDSNWLTVVRMISAGILLLAVALVTRRKELLGALSSRWGRMMLVVFGVCGLMVSQYTYLTAVQYTNSGTATVLQDIGPVLIMVVTCVMARRPAQTG